MSKNNEVWFLFYQHTFKDIQTGVYKFYEGEGQQLRDRIKNILEEDKKCFLCLVKGKEYQIEKEVKININVK